MDERGELLECGGAGRGARQSARWPSPMTLLRSVRQYQAPAILAVAVAWVAPAIAQIAPPILETQDGRATVQFGGIRVVVPQASLGDVSLPEYIACQEFGDRRRTTLTTAKMVIEIPDLAACILKQASERKELSIRFNPRLLDILPGAVDVQIKRALSRAGPWPIFVTIRLNGENRKVPLSPKYTNELGYDVYPGPLYPPYHIYDVFRGTKRDPKSTSYALPPAKRPLSATAPLAFLCFWTGAPARLCSTWVLNTDQTVQVGVEWFEDDLPQTDWGKLDVFLRAFGAVILEENRGKDLQ